MPLGNPIRKQNESRMVSVLATEGQTVFTVQGGYIINHISVFRNGVRLSPAEDFTAGDGSTVTLNNAANIDDRIDFHIFDRFTVQNAIIGAASTQTINGDLVLNGKLFGQLDVPSINLTGIITATELDLNGKGDISGDLNVAGVSTFSGDVNLGDATSDTITPVGRFDASILPASNGAYNLGASGLEFLNLFIEGTAKIDTLTVDENATVTGILTAASFVGPVTGTASGNPTLANGANNRVITATGANALTGESSLTYDGTKILNITSTGGGFFQGTDSDGGIGLLEMGNGDVAIQADTGNSINNSKIHFFLDGSEKARITSDGKMGLGTNSPQRLLHLSSNNTVLALTDTAASTDQKSKYILSDAGAFAFGKLSDDYGTATEQFRIGNSGNIGIGEQSPLTKLHIKVADSGASAYAHSALFIEDSDHTFIDVMSGTSGSGGINFGDSGNAQRGVVEYNHSGDYMRFITAQGERVRIASDGDMGVGTASPSVRLHVSGGDGLLVERSAGTSIAGFKHSGASAMNIYFQNTGSTNHPSIGSENQNLTLGTNNTERMRILSDGSIIMGSATYGSSLGQLRIINDASSTPASLALFGYGNTNDGDAFAQIQFAEQEAGTGGQIKAKIEAQAVSTNERGADLVFFTAANSGSSTPSERLRITDDGKVGVNGEPEAKFMVTDVSYPDIGMKYSGTSGNHKTRLMFIDKRGVINAQVANVLQDDGVGSAAAHLEFATSHGGTLSAQMHIDRYGRVSIGDELTSAHAGKFQVIHNGGGNQTGDTLAHFETNANDWILNLENDEGAGTAHFVYFKKDGNSPGAITATNTTTSYQTSGSDRELKKNFESWTEDTLSLFKNVNPQKFHFKIEDDSAEKTKGFVAQDMVDKFPEAYLKDEKRDDMYYFNPSGMVVYLMKALQESTTKIETLEAKVAALEGS